jgi:hypothetical protein
MYEKIVYVCVCAHQSYVERVAWNEYKMFWNRYIAILNKEKIKKNGKKQRGTNH